eukprot:2982327-Pleurochrysis_carterae.AAC.1
MNVPCLAGRQEGSAADSQLGELEVRQLNRVLGYYSGTWSRRAARFVHFYSVRRVARRHSALVGACGPCGGCGGRGHCQRGAALDEHAIVEAEEAELAITNLGQDSSVGWLRGSVVGWSWRGLGRRLCSCLHWCACARVCLCIGVLVRRYVWAVGRAFVHVYGCVCVFECVRACVRACVHACVRAC